MEKLRPHYDIAQIQAKVTALGIAVFTKTAIDGGRAMGLTSGEMLEVIAGIGASNFYKSMTTVADRRVWQDVFRAPDSGGQGSLHQSHDAEDGPPVIQFKGE